MDRHPKEFVDGWAEDLAALFHQADRRYQRALDRGTPRERAVREVLQSFLPKKFGIASGHVVSSAPSWSRQSDVIIYNALEAPVFSADDDFQGSVLPVETVFGIIEVKSTLDLKTFNDAATKIAHFKRLCCNVPHPSLRDRFGAVFAFRSGTSTPEEFTAILADCVTAANAYPESERVDDIFVLGLADDLSDGAYVARVPHDSPTGPLNYSTTRLGLRNIRIFLLHLESRLRRIRTGAPPDMLSYFFDPTTELTHQSGPDPRAQRLTGAEPLTPDVIQERIIPKIQPAQCPMCKGKQFSSYNDVYSLVATKDYHFGRLGGPYVPVAVLECLGCRWLGLFPTNAYDITTAG